MPVYTQGQFLDFCETVFGNYRLTSGGTNIEVVCPICKPLKEKITNKPYVKQKLAIQVDTHQLHCWVCGYKSRNLIHLLKRHYGQHAGVYLNKFADAELLNQLEQDESEYKKEKINRLPKGFTFLATAGKSVYTKNAINYLKTRGIDSENMLWYWKLGISNADKNLANRIIVPSYDEYGQINYYSARAIKDRIKPKYYNPDVSREDIIFNEININWEEPLTIVEGVFDLFKCNDNATCILGKELDGSYKLFQKIILNKTPVTLALDPGTQKETFNIAKTLFEFEVPVKILTLKKGQEDVGAISKTEFMELLNHATVYNTEYFLRSKIASIL